MIKILITIFLLFPFFANAQILQDSSFIGGNYIVDLESQFENVSIQGISYSNQNDYDIATTSNICPNVIISSPQTVPDTLNLGVVDNTYMSDGSGGGNADCSLIGIYYTVWERVSDGQDFYGQFFWNGSEATTTIPDANTQIIFPESGTTTATTSIDIEIDYTNSEVQYSHLVYKIISTYLFENVVEIVSISIGTTSGTFNASTTLDIGTYRIESYLYDTTLDRIDFPIDSHDFTIIENPLGDLIGIDPDDYLSIAGLATTSCSITNLTGCFQNALIFAFYPSADALQNFGNLIDSIERKPPFGYFEIITGVIDDLSSNATPAFALESEDNITTNVFDPLKTGMTWILWLVFGFWIYNRIKNITI